MSRTEKRLNKLGVITKKQLSVYTESLLRYFYLYCVEVGYIPDSTNFDDWTTEVHKYFKYCKSEYFDSMSFDEFKKGYDIA